jgi:hydrogenase maturation factor
MDFKNDSSRMLFLKYALPCADTLVERGTVSKKLIKDSIRSISLNRKVSRHPEKIFKTAHAMCEKIARRARKKSIDEIAVRRYFLFEHDKIVDSRYELFNDFDPLQCRVFPGKILKIKNKEALIKTIIGKKKYRTNFIQNLRIGDCVVVHRSFTVEKISESMLKKLWKLKENYFKSNS